VAAALLLSITLAWWGWGRLGAPERALRVVRSSTPGLPDSTGIVPIKADSAGHTLRILTWNIAHGRGTPDYGLLRNFRGGGAREREDRLRRIADVIRQQDADLVVLNEADFDATWSGGVSHPAVLAAAAGYPVRVEQANYDVRLPFVKLHFGNALLSRLPVQGARPVELPPHRRVEEWLMGAKSASVVRLATPSGPVAVVPLHLEARSPRTRRAALPHLREVAAAEAVPVVLAGDFKASPPGWGDPVQRVAIGRGSPPPERGGPGPAETIVGELLQAGFRSPRAGRDGGPEDWTYPSPAPDRAIDWILVEPPLQVREATVLQGPALDSLSDHRPVLAVVVLPGDPR
jgi:endonuclease/exonuclease/phosphatase family metal-dependent hydrolase